MKTLKSIIAVAAVSLSLSACGHSDPSLANGVGRIGSGIYQASEMSGFNVDVMTQAVRQCAIEGKVPDVMATSTKEGLYSGNKYATMMFRCI